MLADDDGGGGGGGVDEFTQSAPAAAAPAAAAVPQPAVGGPLGAVDPNQPNRSAGPSPRPPPLRSIARCGRWTICRCSQSRTRRPAAAREFKPSYAPSRAAVRKPVRGPARVRIVVRPDGCQVTFPFDKTLVSKVKSVGGGGVARWVGR